jgi:hypothetical protein
MDHTPRNTNGHMETNEKKAAAPREFLTVSILAASIGSGAALELAAVIEPAASDTRPIKNPTANTKLTTTSYRGERHL